MEYKCWILTVDYLNSDRFKCSWNVTEMEIKAGNSTANAFYGWRAGTLANTKGKYYWEGKILDNGRQSDIQH